MESPRSEDDNPILPGDDQSTGSGGRFTGRALLGAVGMAAIAVFFLLAVFSGGNNEAPSDVEEFAALAFLTTSGDTSTLSDFQGDPLVVNFFASWCAPCRAELPDFEAVHLANGDAVRFVGVNHDLDEVTWRNFVNETGITYETVFQPNAEIWTAMDAKGTPATAFVSADGQLLELWTGVLNDAKLQELIDQHLLEKV